MRYKFDLTRWVRIWFSKNPNEFLPEQNQKRTLDFFQDELRKPFDVVPKKLTFVYSQKLLNEKGRGEFELFKNKLKNAGVLDRVTFVDFSSDAFKEQMSSASYLEQCLFALAQEELDNLATGGNVAAASDIVRLLPPSYTRGIYTDFDVPTPSIRRPYIELLQPVVFPYQSDDKKVNNDVLAVGEGEICRAFLEETQRSVFEHETQFDAFIQYIRNLQADSEKDSRAIQKKMSPQEWEAVCAYHNEVRDILDKAEKYVKERRSPIHSTAFFSPPPSTASENHLFRKFILEISTGDPQIRQVIYAWSIMVATGPYNVCASRVPAQRGSSVCDECKPFFEAVEIKPIAQDRQKTGTGHDSSWLPSLDEIAACSENRKLS